MNEVKCPNCGAPIVNGRCTYCNYVVPTINNNSTNPNVVRQTVVNQPQQNVRFERYKEVVTTPPKKKHKGLKIVGIFFLVLLILGLIGSLIDNDSESSASGSAEEQTEDSSIWAANDTDINEFEYYLDGEDIYLKDYKGKEKKIRIGSVYTIDGKERHVVALTEGTFALKHVDSVILPEGVRSVEGNTFNSSRIKFLYIPSTLENVPSNFWGYFNDMQKIYYGGSEEQWKTICDEDRGNIDVVEIVYNANINDLQ